MSANATSILSPKRGRGVRVYPWVVLGILWLTLPGRRRAARRTRAGASDWRAAHLWLTFAAFLCFEFVLCGLIGWLPTYLVSYRGPHEVGTWLGFIGPRGRLHRCRRANGTA